MAGEPSNDVPQRLAALAGRKFMNLTEAELRVLRGASGPDCTTCQMVPPTLGGDDPSNAHTWGKEREVRADLIRWLCIEASKHVASHGIQVRGSKVVGRLDLESLVIPFFMTFLQCRLNDIDLRYATIANLNLGGCVVDSLNADGAVFNKVVALNRGFTANGEVRLVGAHIDGSLDCQEGVFNNQDVAFHADRLEVKGDASFLRAAMTKGDLRLLAAQIGGDVNCQEGVFDSVTLAKATMKNLFWRKVTNAGHLDLGGTTVGVLSDDESSWPGKDNLYLDGFVYGRIINAPTDAEKRIKWLDAQVQFSHQPYIQLAKVLREMGYDDDAKAILFELQRRTRALHRQNLRQDHPVFWMRDSVEDGFSKAIIGYGIYPMNAIWETAMLALVGWLVFWRAHRMGMMVPTDKEARTDYRKSKKTSNYEPFSPIIYSVENCVPFVKFGQDDRWHADPDFKPSENPTRSQSSSRIHSLFGLVKRICVWIVKLTPARLRWYRRIMIAVGWLLATFFVAGLAGLIKPS